MESAGVARDVNEKDRQQSDDGDDGHAVVTRARAEWKFHSISGVEAPPET